MLAAALCAITPALTLVCAVGTARATFPGANGQIAVERFTAQDTNGSLPDHESDALLTRQITLAGCDNSAGALSCDFGAPSYSPTGRRVVVSRQIPADPFAGVGGSGQLMLLDADATRASALPRLTADDEHPAFLPDGGMLVFDGVSSPGAPRNLYTVSIDGSGLRRVTSAGGSNPAPCVGGTIAFVRRGNLYLLSRDLRRARRLTTRGAGAPSCGPNGRVVAFVRDGRLYTITTAGRRLRLVTRAPAAIPAFSPDGRRLAFLTTSAAPAANGDATELAVVDLRGRPAIPRVVIAASGFSGNSGTSYRGSSAGLAWQPVRTSLTVLARVAGSPLATAGGASPPASRAVALSAGGRLLASANADGTVTMFSIRFDLRGRVRSFRRAGRRAVPGATAVSFARTGRLLAVAQAGGRFSLFAVDRTTGALTAVPGSPYEIGGPGAPALAIDPAAVRLAAAGSTGAVSIYAIDPVSGALTPVPGSPFAGLDVSAAQSAAFSQSGTTLAVGSRGAGVYEFLVDSDSGALTVVPGSPFGPIGVNLLDYPPYAGSLRASATGLDGEITIAAGNGPSGPLAGLSGSPVFGVDPVIAQAFGPDGSLLAGTTGSEILLAALPGFVTPDVPGVPTTTGTGVHAQAIAISADDRLLATGNSGSAGRGGTVSLWRLVQSPGLTPGRGKTRGLPTARDRGLRQYNPRVG